MKDGVLVFKKNGSVYFSWARIWARLIKKKKKEAGGKK